MVSCQAAQDRESEPLHATLRAPEPNHLLGGSYWLNLQATFDLKLAEQSMGKRLKAVAELAHA